jgi:diaminohydroxyphosphoribosylaminopyrimidine deaminase / 5-amino-6-(5-phosphoribosylamino)uracil reductase
MRAHEQAILVGNATVLADNPNLTTREVAGPNPLRIVVDPSAKIKPNRPYQVLDGQAPSLIFNLAFNHEDEHNTWIKLNNKADFLKEMMSVLYQKNIQSILVEGGRGILQSFIDQDLWDEALQITAPQLQLLQGTSAPKLVQKAYRSQILHNNVLNFYHHPNNIFFQEKI